MENKEKIEVVKALQHCGIERYRLALEEIEKDLEQKEYTDRKNADLLETIECFKQHAFIKKTSKSGIEIFVTLHSNDEDFKKVSWVFDIIK